MKKRTLQQVLWELFRKPYEDEHGNKTGNTWGKEYCIALVKHGYKSEAKKMAAKLGEVLEVGK